MALHFLILILTFHLSAQDERMLRKFFERNTSLIDQSQELRSDNPSSYGQSKISVESRKFFVDLNLDGEKELFWTQKRDDADFFYIARPSGEIIFSKIFLSSGKNSTLYRMKQVKLNEKDILLILYYREGDLGESFFRSSARLFFIVIEDSQLNQIYFHPGPQFYWERKNWRHQYILRQHQVQVLDLDLDGTREVIVRYSNITRTYHYKGQGLWQVY